MGRKQKHLVKLFLRLKRSMADLIIVSLRSEHMSSPIFFLGGVQRFSTEAHEKFPEKLFIFDRGHPSKNSVESYAPRPSRIRVVRCQTIGHRPKVTAKLPNWVTAQAPKDLSEVIHKGYLNWDTTKTQMHYITKCRWWNLENVWFFLWK